MSSYLRNPHVPVARINGYPKRTRFPLPAGETALPADHSVIQAHPFVPDTVPDVCYEDFFRVPIQVAS